MKIGNSSSGPVTMGIILTALLLLAASCEATATAKTQATPRRERVALGPARPNLRAKAPTSSSILSSATTTMIETRKLQLGTGVLDRYQVGESTIDFYGMAIKFVYPLSDLVPDDSISIKTYSDTDCSVDISDNTYLTHEIKYDDNPDPTGEKNREVTVIYTFDPEEIRDKDVWVRDENNQVFLTFCTGIVLHTAPLSDPISGPFTQLDTTVFLEVNLEGGFAEEFPVGPADRLDENAQESYTIEGFICDEDNKLLESDRPMVQGEKVRICVKPTKRALADGILMRQVDSFTFYRFLDDGTQVTQTALVDGASASLELTEITCPRGSTVCWFETLLKAEFFFKTGVISGYGEAWLQFGGESARRLEIGSRKLIDVPGGFAQSASLEVSFFGVPGGIEYLAEAFHCDQYNQRLDPPPPLYVGNSARICVAPNDEGREVGIRIHKIENFHFTRGSNRQDAVADNGGTSDGQSVVICKPNSEVCAFRTILRDDFFTSSGLVGAFGFVTLQYKKYSVHSVTFQNRRLRKQSSIIDRELEEYEYLIAGQSSVNVDTLVLYQTDETLNACAFQHEFGEWWLEESTASQVKIIIFIVMIGGSLGLFVVCCWLVPPFFFRNRRTVNKSGNDVHVNVEVKKETEHTNLTEERADIPLVTPGKYDIVFGERRRPMTQRFLKHVKAVAMEHESDEYGPSIYRSCKKPFENSEYFSRDVEGKYKKLAREEAIAMIGKAFVEAKIHLGEDSTVLDPTVGGFTVATGASTDITGIESRRTRMIRRINSAGRLIEVPNEDDVVLGDDNHIGTQHFLRIVNDVAAENPNSAYQASIYRAIRKCVKGSDFFSVCEDGTYHKPRKSEVCSLVGEVYEAAQSRHRIGTQTQTPSRVIDVNDDHPDDMSSIGESLYRPWEDEKSRKSNKSRRSRSSSKGWSGEFRPSRSSSKGSRLSKSDSRLSGKSLKRKGSSSKLIEDLGSTVSKDTRPSHRKTKSVSDLKGNLEISSRPSKRSKKRDPSTHPKRTILDSSKSASSDGSKSIKLCESSTSSSRKSRSKRTQGKHVDPSGAIQAGEDPPEQ